MLSKVQFGEIFPGEIFYYSGHEYFKEEYCRAFNCITGQIKVFELDDWIEIVVDDFEEFI